MSKEYLEERLKKIINDTNSKCPTDIIHKEQFFEIKLKDLSKTNEKEYNENVKLCDLEWDLIYYPYGDPSEKKDHIAIYLENFSVSKRFKMMHDEFKCSEDNLIFYNLNAKFAICLRDKNYNYIAKSISCSYNGNETTHGFENFITADKKYEFFKDEELYLGIYLCLYKNENRELYENEINSFIKNSPFEIEDQYYFTGIISLDEKFLTSDNSIEQEFTLDDSISMEHEFITSDNLDEHNFCTTTDISIEDEFCSSDNSNTDDSFLMIHNYKLKPKFIRKDNKIYPMIVREKQIQVNQSKDYFIYKILFSIRGDDYSWYKVKASSKFYLYKSNDTELKMDDNFFLDISNLKNFNIDVYINIYRNRGTYKKDKKTIRNMNYCYDEMNKKDPYYEIQDEIFIPWDSSKNGTSLEFLMDNRKWNLKNQKNGQNNEIIICSSDSSNHQEVEKYYIRTAYLYESIKIKSKPMISNNLLLLKPEKDNCIIKGFSYINPIIIYIRVYKAIDEYNFKTSTEKALDLFKNHILEEKYKIKYDEMNVKHVRKVNNDVGIFVAIEGNNRNGESKKISAYWHPFTEHDAKIVNVNDDVKKCIVKDKVNPGYWAIADYKSLSKYRPFYRTYKEKDTDEVEIKYEEELYMNINSKNKKRNKRPIHKKNIKKMFIKEY